MLPTLYDALGLREDASAERIRAALRGQIRKYSTQTRDSEGSVEDALRLVDHTGRILTDPELRARYDAAIEAARQAVAINDSHGTAPVGAAGDAEPQASIPYTVTVDAGARPGGQAARRGGLTEKIRVLRGPGLPVIAAGLAVLFLIAFTAGRLAPADPLARATGLLLALATALAFAAAAHYAVHLGFRWWWPVAARDATPVIDLGAVGWRHRDSLFLGEVEVRRDAGWLFDLRTAELDRARVRRNSIPQPWRRLAARMFDYGLWGLVLWCALGWLADVGAVSRVAADTLAQPLLAAVVITASWMPIEALALALARTTPGKWLFGVHVQFAISDPNARHDRTTDILRGASRALRVWLQGLAGGIVALAPMTMAYARERLSIFGETRWDGAGDCLVTHSPLTAIGAATGTVALVAFAGLYGMLWAPALDGALIWSRAQLATVIPAAGDARRSAEEVRGTRPAPGDGAALDAEIEANFARRRERVATLNAEGPRQLDARNYRQAAQLCSEWADLDGGNVRAWQCLGRSLNALREYREAIAALKRARQLAPQDSSIDADIARSERGLVEDFRSRGAR